MLSFNAVLGEKRIDRFEETCPRCGSTVSMDVLLRLRGMSVFGLSVVPSGVDIVKRCGMGHVFRVKDGDDKLNTLKHIAGIDDELLLYDSLEVQPDGSITFKESSEAVPRPKKKGGKAVYVAAALIVLASLAGIVFLQAGQAPANITYVNATETMPVSTPSSTTPPPRMFVFNISLADSPPIEAEVYLNDILLGTTSGGALSKAVTDLGPGTITFKGVDGNRTFKVTSELQQVDLQKYGGLLVEVSQDDMWTYYSDMVEGYARVVRLNDSELGAGVAGLVAGCPPKSKECRIAAVYSNFTMTYMQYPEHGASPIRTPDKTMFLGGGGHDDLNALLLSLMDGAGVKTYLVVSKEGHTWGIACGVNQDEMRKYAGSVFARKAAVQPISDTASVQSHYFQPLSLGDFPAGDTLSVHAVMDSAQPISVYYFKNKADMTSFMGKGSQTEDSNCTQQSKKHLEGDCSVPGSGYLAVYNEGFNTARVSYNLTVQRTYLVADTKRLNMKFYPLGETDCVAVDPSAAGTAGYVGLEFNPSDDKLAVDLSTLEKTSLY
jgi:hypothetical protein